MSSNEVSDFTVSPKKLQHQKETTDPSDWGVSEEQLADNRAHDERSAMGNIDLGVRRLDDDNNEEFMDTYSSLASAINEQGRNAPHVDIVPGQCYHCAKVGHQARNCPTGGSFRTMRGRLQQIGGRPRCFACAMYTSHHNSSNCPFRHPDSFADPRRCWNCGRFGHRLNQCPYPRMQFLKMLKFD